jgi:hypothetical protein
MAGISKHLTSFYASGNRGRTSRCIGAIGAVQRLYQSNVFPEMKISWGTYLPQLGHMDAPGCFRCHTTNTRLPPAK